MSHPSIRGRGAAHNLANRFDHIAVERDEWVEAEDPAPETQFFRDTTRTIIARNESPDVAFEASVNPYRGCDRGCLYCIHGSSAVLMADGTTRPIADLQAGDEIYGTVAQGWRRRLVKTAVLAHWETAKPAYRVLLEDGTDLVASGDHRLLTARGWKYVAPTRVDIHPSWHLAVGDKVFGIGTSASRPSRTTEYMRGYLCGVIRGDGMLRSYEYERVGRAHGNQHHFRLVMGDDEALHRTAHFLLKFGVSTHSFLFQEEAHRRIRLRGIRTHACDNVRRIKELIAWRLNPTTDWTCGFLAGIFDAEGSYSGSRLGIANTDPAIVKETANSLRRLGFGLSFGQFGKERRNPVSVVSIIGGLTEHLRFLQTVEPAILRKRDLVGRTIGMRHRVVWIEPVGQEQLFDITTGTEDFIANGSLQHNCYARPGHEYFGLSAGLDFETKIFVKE